jgi:hypothetical protein
MDTLLERQSKHQGLGYQSILHQRLEAQTTFKLICTLRGLSAKIEQQSLDLEALIRRMLIYSDQHLSIFSLNIFAWNGNEDELIIDLRNDSAASEPFFGKSRRSWLRLFLK